MLLILSVLSARAEDSTFAGAAAGTAAEKSVTAASADLGAAWTSGNTETLTVNAAGHGSHMWERNKLGLEIVVNFGQTVADANADGFLDETERDAGYTKNAEHYQADLRYDRFLSDKNSLYALAGALMDEFAGYDSRVHGQLGYSRYFVKNDTTEFVGEIGADVANEDYVDGVDPNRATIVAAREMLGIKHKFNDSVSLEEKIEAYENVQDFDDLRVLNGIALTSQVSGKVSIKLSHTLTFDNVPVEGFEKLDQTAMATVVVTLL
jgi:putative salt-induced outer membrane protein YdiY